MQTFQEKLKSIYLKGEGLPHDRIVPTVGLNICRIEDANENLVFGDLGSGRPRIST
jgi:ADP-ribosylation factor related protein 1